MQLTLLIVNFFLITIISRVYGAEIYGEYASAKSLSVLIGTAIVLSLALVVTKGRAQNIKYSKEIFYNSYYLVIRNLLLSLILLIPLTIIFGRDYRMTSLFLVGFVFNEMIHIALAYYQAQGNFVITSKQIILRTILYGLGAWVIVSQGFSIIWVIVYQAVVLYIFFIVAHLYIPKNELNNNTNKETVAQNNILHINGLSSETVGGNTTSHITGNHTETINGSIGYTLDVANNINIYAASTVPHAIRLNSNAGGMMIDVAKNHVTMISGDTVSYTHLTLPTILLV